MGHRRRVRGMVSALASGRNGLVGHRAVRVVVGGVVVVAVRSVRMLVAVVGVAVRVLVAATGVVLRGVVMVVRVVVVAVIVIVVHHAPPRATRASRAATRRCTTIAALNPASMLTTATPLAQLVSMARSGVRPPSAVP